MFLRKKIIISIFFILKISLNAEENNDFKLTLEYFSRPVINKEWQISIYKTNNKFYIKSEKYLFKTFTKRISYQQYVMLLKKLNKLGIKTARGCYPKNSQNEFYKITLKTRTFTNKFKVPAKIPLYGKNTSYYQMIRLIKNFTKDISRDF